MKLAAIYNVWDGVELLRGSMNCLKNKVDLFIIVYQDVSNWGEKYDPLPDMNLEGFNFILLKYTPKEIAGQPNETSKRNFGLQIAKDNKCSHFLFVDCDEYYDNFAKAKNLYLELGCKGSVVRILTYFKKPTLRFENPDNYFVPFIHQLLPETTAGKCDYPFYVDRTRMVNCDNVVLIDTYMHHFSYVRKDIEIKCRNSSAKRNIARSQLLPDYHNNEVKEGFFVKDFGQKLIEVENIFDISV